MFPVWLGQYLADERKKILNKTEEYIPVCILEKLPHALNDNPSTIPPTKPHIIKTISVCVVSMFDRKWRERVAGIEFSSCPWLPERDTAVLPPEDHSPGVYFVSSFVVSKRKFAVVKSFGSIAGLSGVSYVIVLDCSILFVGEGGWSCIMICD